VKTFSSTAVRVVVEFGSGERSEVATSFFAFAVL
jgi:hypothetical protein